MYIYIYIHIHIYIYIYIYTHTYTYTGEAAVQVEALAEGLRAQVHADLDGLLLSMYCSWFLVYGLCVVVGV